MKHKDVVIVVNRHDDCGVPQGVLETCVDIEFSSRAEDTHNKSEGSTW